MQAPVMQQPMASPGMMMAGGNRNAKNLPMDATGREWSNGVCDCCNDPGTCVMATCCSCIVYGQNKQRYEHLSQKNAPDPERGGTFNNDCFTHCLITACCGVGWVLQISNRSNIRSRYSIRGDGMNDCCTTFWCQPCALTQEAQELELEESSFSVYQKA